MLVREFAYKKDSKVYAHILLLFIFGPSINFYVNYFIQVVCGKQFSLSIAFYLFISLCGLFCLVRSFIKKQTLIIAYILVGLLVLFSYLLYPELRDTVFNDVFNPVYSKPYNLFVYCLPVCFFIICFWTNSSKYVKKYIWHYSFVCLSIGLLDYFFYVTNSLKLQYMTFSYNMLTSTIACFAYNKFSNSKKPVFRFLLTLFGMLGFFCILFSGSRGALLSAVMAMFVVAFSGNSRNNKKIFALGALLIVLALVIINLNSILEILVNISENLGITKIRTLDKLLDNSLFVDEGRELRQQAIISGLFANPFGYGLYGDYHCSFTYGNIDSYAHNILFEMLADFGIFFGGGLFIFLIVLLVKSLTKENAYLIVILLPYGFFQLFFSGSFLSEISSFMLLGALVVTNKKKQLLKERNFIGKHNENCYI